jgi:phosphatidylserine/phosphatidylglycerophosphate/cardiolipin synthase-like enzyme
VQLLVQPDDGAEPVLEAIAGAKANIDVYIFRLAHRELEAALRDAVGRGVTVRALVAHTNGGGKESVRKLEQRLLDIGAAVSRTDDDLLRYHGKMMIIDQSKLLVLGYNFTRKDIDDSRSLGVVTERPELVREALRLFEADCERRTYVPTVASFLVSPLNSRAGLLALIEGARKTLRIYDSRLSDNRMLEAIELRALAGVDVRIIGKIEKDLEEVQVEPSPVERLHVRAIVQDEARVFIGSQSLRRAELEKRREIGVILEDRKVVLGVAAIFESDWAATDGDVPDETGFARSMLHAVA